ncbi:Esc8p [Rhodotorula paludigena]|uniref:Esc8p n=1 Tax=Rhodotorula paludigena TaxID=86838 RepID=UPI00317BEE16
MSVLVDDPSLDMMAVTARPEVALAILGPYIVGMALQLLLDGFFLALFVAYKDRASHSRAVQAVSWGVLFLVLCCTGMAFEEIVDTAVSQARDSTSLLAGPPQSNVSPILAGVTGAVCQGFLMVRAALLIPTKAYRIAFYVFTTSTILLGLVGSLLFASEGFFATQDRAFPLTYFSAQAIWQWASAAADLLVSLALAYTLHQRIAGFNKRTDGLLKKLIVISLQTAAYTSVFAIVGAALSSAHERSQSIYTSTIAFTFWLPLAPLHAISLRTTLSTRRVIQNELGGHSSGGTLTHTAPTATQLAALRNDYGDDDAAFEASRLRAAEKEALAAESASRRAGGGAKSCGGGIGSRLFDLRTGGARRSGVGAGASRSSLRMSSHGATDGRGSTTSTATSASHRVPLEVKVEREEEVSYDVADAYDDEYDSTEATRSRRISEWRADRAV